jgi:hypothetical protein
MSSNTENEGGAKTEPGCESNSAKEVRQAFASLPLDQRFSTLIRVQLDMVGEVANTVVSEASKAFDELADALVGKKKPSGPTGPEEQAPQA